MRGLTAKIVGLVAVTLCLGCCTPKEPYNDSALLFPEDANDREMKGDHQSDDLGLDYDESDH